MSFNGTFGNGAGLTLPSFTNVKPTVYVSGVVTGAENGELLLGEVKNGKADTTNRPETANSADSDNTEMQQQKQKQEETVKTGNESDTGTGEVIAAKKTSAASFSLPQQESDREEKVKNNAETTADPAATLEAILASHNRKTNQKNSKEHVLAVESHGKGVPLDEDSSEEETEVLNEKSSVGKERSQIAEVSGAKVDAKIGNSDDNDDDDDDDDDNDDDDDDDDSSSIINEKQFIGNSKDESRDDSKDDEQVGQFGSLPLDTGISTDEELINRTLAQAEGEGDEIDRGSPSAQSAQKSEEESKDEKLKIDKEVEAEVNKIQTNVSESTIAEELDDRVPLHKITRNNSIKDIPNPPSNLKKQQAFDFQTFLAQFKSKDCQHAHKYLKSFLDQFNQRIWTVEEQIKLLNEFQEFLFQKLTHYKPFDEMGSDETKINNCKEGLEKLIMTKVYNSVFSPAMSFIKLTDSHKHDKLMDRKYLMNTYLYNWVELRHLDLDMLVKVESNFITLASAELSKIDDYKSPRDKIVCILNSSKIIFELIRQQETQENADSFVPLLIYVLLHSRFKHLYSNLQYIERFRNRDFLIGETSYYVSTMQIACNFIISLTKDQLTIDDTEFEEKMKESKLKLRELQQGGRATEDSPSQVLTKSAEMVKQSLSNSINTFIQNITSEEQVDNPEQQRNAEHPSRRHRSTNRLEVSDEELERIKQLSVEENNALDHQRSQRKEILQQLTSMFPTLDQGLIEDVLGGCLGADGYNVSECVNSLLALSE